MRKLIMTGVSALTLAVAPGVLHAQDAAPMPPAAAAPSEMALTPEQQGQFDAWPAEVKTYYGTLDANQKEAFWFLTDEQRSQLMALPDEQKAQTWSSILAQVEAARNGTPAPSAAPAPGAAAPMPAPAQPAAPMPAPAQPPAPMPEPAQPPAPMPPASGAAPADPLDPAGSPGTVPDAVTP